MDKARIEELVALIHAEAEKRGVILINHDDYIRAALTTAVREAFEEAAKVGDEYADDLGAESIERMAARWLASQIRAMKEGLK